MTRRRDNATSKIRAAAATAAAADDDDDDVAVAVMPISAGHVQVRDEKRRFFREKSL